MLIKKKLIIMSGSISFVVVFLVAAVSGYLINKQHSLLSGLISKKSADLLSYLQTTSQQAQEALAKESFDSLETKAKSLVRKDSLALGIALTENSILFARQYISQAVTQDPDIVEGAFYTKSNDRIELWQMATKQSPAGIPLGSTFDKSSSSWKFQGKTIHDPTFGEVIGSQGETIRVIEKNGLKYIDISYEVESEDTGAKAYLRYQLTTENIEKSIQREKAKLAASLKIQNENEIKSNHEMSTTTSDLRSTSLLFLLFIVAISFGLAYIIASRASYLLTIPLNKLKQGAQKISEGHYELSLDVQSKDEIGELAQHFNEMRIKVKDFTANLRDLVEQRTKELASSLSKIKAVFDTIEQGIVTISSSPARIDSDMSPFIEVMFKEPTAALAGKSFQEVFLAKCKLDADSKAVINDVICACIDADLITWEVNRDKLPRNVQMMIAGETRYIQVEWCPMLAEDGAIYKILVAMKDLTVVKLRELQLEGEIKAQEEEINRIAAIVANSKESLVLFVGDVGKRIGTIQAALESPQHDSVSTKSIYHELHTIKGQARILKLQEIANESHLAESVLKEFAGERTELSKQVDKLALTYTNYVGIMATKLGWSFDEPVVDFTSLMHKEIMAFKLALSAKGIPVQLISLSDKVIQWNKATIADIKAMLSHLINNSIDHGYIQPASEGVTCIGELSITAELSDKWVVISVVDSGKGFDLQKISNRAKELGIDASQFENPIEAILIPEFSTAKNLTQRSGRGVGMSAVKSIVDSYHGSIELENNEKRGAYVRIFLPAVKVMVTSLEGREHDLAS